MGKAGMVRQAVKILRMQWPERYRLSLSERRSPIQRLLQRKLYASPQGMVSPQISMIKAPLFPCRLIGFNIVSPDGLILATIGQLIHPDHATELVNMLNEQAVVKQTPSAENDPDRSTTISLHIIDLIYLLEGLRLLNKQPHGFDSAATDYRPLYMALVQSLKTIDAEYVKHMLDGGRPPHPRESPVHKPLRQDRRDYTHNMDEPKKRNPFNRQTGH